MKLKDIMKPWNGEPIFCDGLDQECDLYSFTADQFAEDSEHPQCLTSGERVQEGRLCVVDRQNRKTGEIRRDMLEAVLKCADIYTVSSLMDTFAEAIVALDEKGIIFYANEMYSSILGVPVGKILGRCMYRIEPGAAALSVLKTMEPVELERQFVRSLGRYISCRITPIFRDGVFRGAISVFSDATEIVKLNAEIQRVSQVAIHLQHRVQAMDQAQSMELVGRSSVFSRLLSQASVVASTDAPVLICGENGTGKELIAKYIHANSARAHKPLITVNCAAIPENLVESELFGYEEGAFTGASRGGKMGKFELASGGTLFLDEIGDMPLSMQTKLLRAIQENEIEKIGGKKNVSVDVRVISATNQPLEEMIEDKRFRTDLYYRINTVILRVPPLRERKEDIPLFARYFLEKYNQKYQKAISFSQDVLNWFLSHSWPGNVRELKNCVENGVILCGGEEFDTGWLMQYRQAEQSEKGQTEQNEKRSAKQSEKGQTEQRSGGQTVSMDFKVSESDRVSTSGNERISTSTADGNRAVAVDRFISEAQFPEAAGQSLRDMLEALEKELILRTLSDCGGNRSQAMRQLELSRRTFYRKLSRHGILS